MTNLGVLVYNVSKSLKSGHNYDKHKSKRIRYCALLFPLVFMILGYHFDDNTRDTVETATDILNNARQAFSCSMRFENQSIEWLLLRIPLMGSSLAVIGFSMALWLKIGVIKRGLGLNSKNIAYSDAGTRSKRKVDG